MKVKQHTSVNGRTGRRTPKTRPLVATAKWKPRPTTNFAKRRWMVNMMTEVTKGQHRAPNGPPRRRSDELIPMSSSAGAGTPNDDTRSSDWVRALTTSISRSNIPQPRPIFADSETSNPVRFLERFELYFKRTYLPEEDKISEVISCLSRQAWDWAEYHKGTWNHFNHFRAAFLDKFWSEDRQHEIRVQLLSRAYDPSRESTMAEYFMRQVNHLRTLTIPLAESLLLADLMLLFPEPVRGLWRTLPKHERTMRGAMDFLERQSLIHPPKKRKFTPHQGQRESNVTTISKEVTSFNPFSVPPPPIVPSGNEKRA